jgi:hypothetical protein
MDTAVVPHIALFILFGAAFMAAGVVMPLYELFRADWDIGGLKWSSWLQCAGIPLGLCFMCAGRRKVTVTFNRTMGYVDVRSALAPLTLCPKKQRFAYADVANAKMRSTNIKVNKVQQYDVLFTVSKQAGGDEVRLDFGSSEHCMHQVHCWKQYFIANGIGNGHGMGDF